MMGRDRAAHRTRSAMDHQPEPAVMVGLKLKKVVAASERAQLHAPVASLEFFQSRITQRRSVQVLGQGGRHGSGRVAVGWDALVQPRQHAGGRWFVGQ